MSNENAINEIALYPKYIMHECECVCEDPNYSHLGVDAPAYAFEVFQLLDKDNKALPVVWKCDNCNRIWKIEDYGEVPEMMDMKTPLSFTKHDLSLLLHPHIAYKLEKHSASTAIYAWCYYNVAQNKFGEKIAWNPKINRFNKSKVKYYEIMLESKNSVIFNEIEVDLDVEVKMR
jgi:hypothetical protein